MISVLGLIFQSSLFIGSGIVSGVWFDRFFYRKSAISSAANNSSGESTSTVVVRLLSNTTVSLAVVLAQLVLCEIGGWVAPEARFVVWKVATTALLALVGLVIPFAEIVIWTRGSSGGTKLRGFWACLLYAVYLLLFVGVGHYIPMDTSGTLKPSSLGGANTAAQSNASGRFSSSGSYSHNASIFAADLQLSFSESVITRIVFVGVTAMAILCGISTVSAPYTVFISKPSPVSQADIDRLDGAITTTGALIETKRHTIHTLRLKLSHRVHTSSSTNLMLKVLSTLRVGAGDELANEIKALDTEIDSLQSMKSDLERDYASLKAKYHNQQYSLTFQGRLKTKLYFVFAVYCLYRFINIMLIRNPFISSWNISRRIYGSSSASASKGESDALVMSLAHMVQLISPQSEIEALSRQIGFAVSGLLFLASISSVATTFSTLSKALPFLNFRKHSNHHGAGANIPLTGLVISQVLAVYVISTSLLLRSNLPSKMSSAITSALSSPLNVSSVQEWSDSVIFASTCVMLVGLYLANKYRSADEVSLYDEEALIETKFD
ncbi:hypothetical protein AWJ20_3456 [Sugiyamaella lignohabitans]|uniref:Uncharacterized protein n=1 Tax=Sugiyamaella lignohabitans TaxID=796027 RepID=A0A167FX34_9ASCO|nr:uncharacterized protein AWJ20_3456 [Sugiyamaella lignohabitans]ANB15812.1 hypothetical protein AWJ20_3456 [Sugiyamaella lignohabitans]